MYTLYGHEGATTAASFSPYGDFFVTGGLDAAVQLWQSNLDTPRGEQIEGLDLEKITNTKIMNLHTDEAPDAKKVKQGDSSEHGSPLSSKVFPVSTKLSDVDS